MTTPAQLRALADRVCAEEPSRELHEALWESQGWIQKEQGWVHVSTPNVIQHFTPPHCLKYLDDAAAMMPAGYSVVIEQHLSGWVVTAMRQHGPTYQQSVCSAEAPTEPRARTALALRVRAVMMEDDNAD